MKAKATTLLTGIAATLALIVPIAQAAPEFGDGAAATPTTQTVGRYTTLKILTRSEPANYFQVLRNESV